MLFLRLRRMAFEGMKTHFGLKNTATACSRCLRRMLGCEEFWFSYRASSSETPLTRGNRRIGYERLRFAGPRGPRNLDVLRDETRDIAAPTFEGTTSLRWQSRITTLKKVRPRIAPRPDPTGARGTSARAAISYSMSSRYPPLKKHWQ
jgi:hypothetical protein